MTFIPQKKDALYVRGVVIACEMQDDQGDTAPNKEGIKKIFTNYLKQESDVQHSYISNFNVHQLENTITTTETTINGQKVPAGSWIASHMVLNPSIIAMIREGHLTGYSLGAIGDAGLNENISFENNFLNKSSLMYKDLRDYDELNPFFISFVDNMLMFYSLDETRYRGYRTGQERIPDAIIEAGKLKEFEQFLHQNNVPLTLAEGNFDGKKEIMVRFNRRFANFYSVASTGTRSLALFYYWFIKMEKASFIYMDEFDAFYHFELAANIIRLMRTKKDIQVIFTTHNTDLLSNDLLRPDCYYWLDNGKIKSLNRLTEKELRKAHNLQKMFKAGAFS